MINLGKISKNGKEIILEKKDNECIECISHCKDSCGYTRIYIHGKHERLFRYIYEQKYGKIPKDKLIRHKCDNPSCCNIEHLEIGTPKDNVTDMIVRGRYNPHKDNPNCRGEKNKFNKLTKEEVKNIFISNESYSKMSKKYNVSKTLIYRIRKQIDWKWYTNTLI